MLNRLRPGVAPLLVRGGLREQLLKGGVGSLLIKLGQGGLSFALAVVLARSMGPGVYGAYSYVLAVIMLIAVPAQLGIPQLIVRETARSELDRNWPLMKGLWQWGNIAVLGFSLLAMLLLFAFLAVTDKFVVSEQNVPFIIAAFLIPIVAISSVWSACLRGLRRVLLGQLPENIIRPGLFLFFIVVWVYFSEGVVTLNDAVFIYIASALFSLALSGLALFYLFPEGIKKTSNAIYTAKRWNKAVLPLAIISGLQLINFYADLIILGFLGTSEDVGVYRAVSQMALLVTFGLGAINQVLQPHFSRFYAEDDGVRLQRLVTVSARLIVFLAIIPFLIFLFFGKDLIVLAFGDEYSGGYYALIILSAGQLANAAFGSVGALLNMTGHEKDTMKGMLVAIVANISLNFLLIPSYGFNGAAVATAVSFVVWNALLWVYVRRRLSIESSVLGG